MALLSTSEPFSSREAFELASQRSKHATNYGEDRKRTSCSYTNCTRAFSPFSQGIDPLRVAHSVGKDSSQ